jgi:hypothetical protein
LRGIPLSEINVAWKCKSLHIKTGDWLKEKKRKKKTLTIEEHN